MCPKAKVQCRKGLTFPICYSLWERKKNRAKEIRHRESWRDREGDVKEKESDRGREIQQIIRLCRASYGVSF